jgi:hypothetical protein
MLHWITGPRGRAVVTGMAAAGALTYLWPDMDPFARLAIVVGAAFVMRVVMERLRPDRRISKNIVVYWNDPKPMDDSTRRVIHKLIEARVFDPGTTVLDQGKLDALLDELRQPPPPAPRIDQASSWLH